MGYQTYLCPQTERERVATEAKRAGVSMSELVRTLVSEALDNREEERFASRLVSLENQVANTLRQTRAVASRVDELYAQNRAQEREGIEREAVSQAKINDRLEGLEEVSATLGSNIGTILMLCGAMTLCDPKIRDKFQKVATNPSALLTALMKPVQLQPEAH
jgi:hypothetical protein